MPEHGSEDHIWPPDGIEDLPLDWPDLAVGSMRQVEEQWKLRLEELRGSESLEKFRIELHREWSIETGQIENVYDIERGVTTSLIEHGYQAALIPHGSANKPPEELVAILKDQEAALDGLFAFVRQDRELTTGYIKELHAMMCRSQETYTVRRPDGTMSEEPLIKGDWKVHPNNPERGGNVILFCPPIQVQSEMDRLIEMHLTHRKAGVPAEVEAAWLHHRFTQVHPFADGNGRVARALATLVLVRESLFPFVVSRDEKITYINALELADKSSLRPLIMMLVRLQQGRFRSAMRLVSRAAPDASTVAEAAEQLALALAHQEETRRNRLAARVQRINHSIHVAMKDAIHPHMDLLRRADPTVRDSYGGPSEIQAIDTNLVSAIQSKYAVNPDLPAGWSAVDLRLKESWRIAAITFTVAEDPNEEVWTVPYLECGPEIIVMPVPPEVFAGASTGKNRGVQDFAGDIMKTALNEIRRRLP